MFIFASNVISAVSETLSEFSVASIDLIVDCLDVSVGFSIEFATVWEISRLD